MAVKTCPSLALAGHPVKALRCGTRLNTGVADALPAISSIRLAVTPLQTFQHHQTASNE
jgi:hypothetical protein